MIHHHSSPDTESHPIRQSRREFLFTGLSLAAVSFLPRLSFGQEAKAAGASGLTFFHDGKLA